MACERYSEVNELLSSALASYATVYWPSFALSLHFVFYNSRVEKSWFASFWNMSNTLVITAQSRKLLLRLGRNSVTTVYAR
ncbi:hypothetical protein EJ04DRAFT_26202 [Polyplosphaeria fusca]|uniref:Uncharacterized protein n=1 Tax=Polyplosphaeria fusca TaxID=682080 RepID=A0A9P4R8I4_9PLEO|nr:hypothetical protein EJ04DRAFT_26202 [Polyplosphaeria fusca]